MAMHAPSYSSYRLTTPLSSQVKSNLLVFNPTPLPPPPAIEEKRIMINICGTEFQFKSEGNEFHQLIYHSSCFQLMIY